MLIPLLTLPFVQASCPRMWVNPCLHSNHSISSSSSHQPQYSSQLPPSLPNFTHHQHQKHHDRNYSKSDNFLSGCYEAATVLKLISFLNFHKTLCNQYQCHHLNGKSEDYIAQVKASFSFFQFLIFYSQH